MLSIILSSHKINYIVLNYLIGVPNVDINSQLINF